LTRSGSIRDLLYLMNGSTSLNTIASGSAYSGNVALHNDEIFYRLSGIWRRRTSAGVVTATPFTSPASTLSAGTNFYVVISNGGVSQTIHRFDPVANVATPIITHADVSIYSMQRRGADGVSYGVSSPLGSYLYYSGGTAATTVGVAQLSVFPNFQFKSADAGNGLFLFRAENADRSAHGLFLTDGTTLGTSQLVELDPAYSAFFGMGRIGNKLYYMNIDPATDAQTLFEY
jgi:hypothetical protein